MEETVPFGGNDYFVLLALLLFARGMDFLSTWVATPNLVLEGNPIAKWLGWKWGIPLNLACCVGFALWPLPAIVLSTTSVLVASRNFQQAWLMRSLGEGRYRDWHVARMQETRVSLFLFCLLGQTALPSVVGGALLYFSQPYLVPMAIGMGIISYAIAVAFYTLLSVWRMRRAMS
ncbi:MAG: hypothetical protein JWR69_765 [Pedosphaera sp.]|nr:hypothetical protein [Pedosphaera sp.]